jgi:regulator of replication initiation timing
MAPKVASAKTIDGAAMFAPSVPAGKYKVVITKGSEKFESWIELRYPEKTVFTLEERKIQQETTKALYNMTEELAYMVYEIDELLVHSAKVINENAALKKQATKLNADLNKLKDVLVITKGDNYVGAGEKQLREKIGDLYSTIGSYYGAPSQSQLETLKMLQTRLNEGKSTFKTIKDQQVVKYKASTEKAGIKFVELKSFEEFVKKN